MLSAWSMPGFGSVVVTCSRPPEPSHLGILVRVAWSRCQLSAGHPGGPVISFLSHHSALAKRSHPAEGFEASTLVVCPTFPKKGLPLSSSGGLVIRGGAGLASEALFRIWGDCVIY